MVDEAQTEIRPSAGLIRYVVGHDDFEEYERGGHEVYTMLDLAARKYSSKPLAAHAPVLDFGCGIGRILHFLRRDRDVGRPDYIFGCDLNGPCIDFVKQNYPGLSAYRNDLMPPLIYRDNLFEIVYSFSVFSHLTRDVEEVWLEELHRVGAPGCLYLITIHGDWVIEMTLSPSDREQAVRDGFFLRYGNVRAGTEFDFPEYYESSYHTSEWIRANWGKRFEVVDIIKGDNPRRYDPAAWFRPMGQDLVVLRKR